jgi:hypothetical protein
VGREASRAGIGQGVPEAAIRIPEQPTDLRPVLEARASRPVRVRGGASVPDLGGSPTKGASLRDGGLRDAVDRRIEGGDRLTGSFTRGEPDLAPNDPPAELAPGNLVDIDLAWQAEEPIAAGDVGFVSVVVTRRSSKAGRGPGEPERGKDRPDPVDSGLLAIGPNEETEQARTLAAVVGLPGFELDRRETIRIEVAAPAWRARVHWRSVWRIGRRFDGLFQTLRGGLDDDAAVKLLAGEARRRASEADHGVLSTIHPSRGVDAVPTCFVIDGDVVAVPVDTVKAKGSLDLRRIRNLEADPRASLLCEHWDAPDWSRLWWVRLTLTRSSEGAATVAGLAAQLRDKYPQYASAPFAAILTLRVREIAGWSAT